MFNDVATHKSRPPLRWIANLAGTIATSGLLRISYAEEYEKNYGFRYYFDIWLWDTFWPIYSRYGTFYTLDMDLSGKEWDDYDENGIPYWEKTGCVDPDYCEHRSWDYEDSNGDAFRLVRRRDEAQNETN